jgi:ribonuclease R
MTKRKQKQSSKEERLIDNLKKSVEQFITGRGYHTPLSLKELMERLHLPEQHAITLKVALEQLIKEKVIEMKENRYLVKQEQTDLVTGVLKVHPRGFGFLQTENANYTEDIFIPKHLTMNAVDGDLVEVLVNPLAISEKGPEGRVVAILERGRTHMGGIITHLEIDGDAIAYVPLLGTGKKVVVQNTNNEQLKVGDRVVMKVIDWGSKETETVCQLSHLIGHISDASCDISAAIEEYELRDEFSSKVIQEAESFGKQVPASEIKKRQDFRDLECFTIDPETAKDFDDALSLWKDEKKGIYHLGVHVADVSHYVKPGSLLDKEAASRCNSTYFPGRCIPMLPGALSENLCSLKPNVNRLAASVMIDLDSNGNLIDYKMVRSVIKSAKRYTYSEAKEILDGKKKSSHGSTLKLMVELCYLLKRKRYERGSVEFALSELEVVVDEKGEPHSTRLIKYDITHQLVEEFMLKANELVAWHLSKLGKGITYRVHDEPAEENMRDFAAIARAFGFGLPDKPTPSELQKLFDAALDTPYAPHLATSFIRRLRLAIYSPENIGHYGLALTHYCHFTSPIRRYVDLVVHRILFEESENPEKDNLQVIATNSSEQERISARAESSVKLLKKLRLLSKVHAVEPTKQYPAVVTKVKNFGFSFDVIDYAIEGFLHVSELDEDYFVFEEIQMCLRGKHTGKIYTPGTQVTVMLKDVDFIYQESKWYLVPEEVDQQEPRKEKKNLSKTFKKGKTKDQFGKSIKRIKKTKTSRPKRRKK